MTMYLRTASLTNYADLARSLGLNPVQMLNSVGLPVGCLDHADLRVPAGKVMRLLELSAEQSGEVAFGLLLSETRRLSTFGLLGLLVRDEPNLRAVLSTFRNFGKLHNESVSVRLEEDLSQDSDVAVLRLDFMPVQGIGRQAIELGVGATYRILRILLGADWTARAVNFMHPAPSQLAAHRRVFGTNLYFGEEFNGIVVTRQDLDTPVAMADPIMREYARRLLGSVKSLDLKKTRYEVIQLILALLPTGRCNADQVALHMGVDRRTIHRRLAQEACNFSDLLLQTRRELAQLYLDKRTQPLTEVAQLLGFGSLSALSRWRREEREKTGLLVRQ